MESNSNKNETKSCFYKCCDKGLMFPIVDESNWGIGLRAFIYFVGMIWCFLGVSILADIFMCSIERITSKTRKIRIADNSKPEGYAEVEVKVWNDTVANLSLLALGTSAPEILLSVIEILGKNFHAGELGPGTIVGSAAFNLLMISAICIVSIPNDEVRRIRSLGVFATTSFSCVFAYIWLALVLLAFSPNVVELWEAIVTFFLFPSLIIISYLVDKKCCMKRKSTSVYEIAMDTRESGEDTPLDKMDKEKTDENVILLARDLARTKELSENQAGRIAAAAVGEKQSHGHNWYRINATRHLMGGRKLTPVVTEAFKEMTNSKLYEDAKMPSEEREALRMRRSTDCSMGGTKPVVEFTATSCAVLESEKKVRVGIKRYGKLDIPVSVRVETVSGSATPGSDYKHINEVVTFSENEKLRQLYIEIVDDFEYEPDEFFFVQLHLVNDSPVVLGTSKIMRVTIIDDDEPGRLEFLKPSFVIKESTRRAKIPVQRLHGADGHVGVVWKTTDMTAFHGKDYEGAEGTLKFENGETTKNIDIFIYDSKRAERDESFQIELVSTEGGATLGKINRTIVTIVNDEEFNGLVSRIVDLTKSNLDALQLDTATWGTHFREAMNVNGGDMETAKATDYVLHFLSFGWKTIFACIPPVSFFGGWPTFLISLGVIGLMTAIIGDLASIFGCLINLPDSITAITFVALGTSMPDTFASMTAAKMEKWADSSVGNINGSNSVNVFLGLGLPWLIASIYWTSKNQVFHVPAGSLGFTVILYTIAAVIALLTLVLRRVLRPMGKAELGGPKVAKWATGGFFVFLWLFYIIMSSLQATNRIHVEI